MSIAHRRQHVREPNYSPFTPWAKAAGLRLQSRLKPTPHSAPQLLRNLSLVFMLFCFLNRTALWVFSPLQRASLIQPDAKASGIGFPCRFANLHLHRRRALLGLLLLFLVGCGGIDPNATPISIFPTKVPAGTGLPTFVALEGPSATPNAGAQPTATPAIRPTVTFRFINPTAPAGPTTIPTLDANWSVLSNGAQFRRLGFRSSTGNDVSVLVVRIDPRTTDIKVRYEPSRARMIQDWRLALPGALVIVNASFYSPPNVPIGLVAVDGNLFGSSIPRQDAGMFQNKNGTFKVRSLFLEPYNNTERFDQVVQGFPMLMVGGQVAPAFDPDLSNVTARRTAIAQDTQGRILFLVTPFSSVSLPDLAKWLGVSGLGIDSAINMDGGGSTSMYLATGGPSQFTQGLSPVPVVLAVYPR